MKYDNLWGINDDSIFSNLKLTDNIREILDDQCQHLKKISNGKVLAKFAKIKKISPIMASPALAAVSTTLSAFSPKEVVGDSENISLQDANDLYLESRYGFEIYNHTYKFRLFEIQMEPVYPITLLLDEGIASCVNETLITKIEPLDAINKYKIDSDENFIECLKIILMSKKVQFIIFRMKESETEQE